MFDQAPNVTPDANIKVIDLGLATRFLGDEFKHMTDRVGTLYSMAPQVLQGVYDYKCDLWSLGVVTYILLSGKQPFWGPPREMSWEKRRKVMIDRIMRCDYMRMKGPSWDKISKEAKQFVASLLQIVPDRRPTASEALQHPWIVRYQNYNLEGVPAQDVQYTKKQHLKRAAQVLLAESLLKDDIVGLKEYLIQHFDSHKQNQVTVRQFHDALLHIHKLDHTQVEALFIDKDLDERGHIDYRGLLNEVLDRRLRHEENKIAHSLFNKDFDRKISKDKLREMISQEASLSSSMSTILESLNGSDNDELTCGQVVQELHRRNLRTIDHFCRCGEEANDKDKDDDEDLLDPWSAIIPGGKSNLIERPKYVYDDASKSMRPCAEGEIFQV